MVVFLRQKRLEIRTLLHREAPTALAQWNVQRKLSTRSSTQGSYAENLKIIHGKPVDVEHRLDVFTPNPRHLKHSRHLSFIATQQKCWLRSNLNSSSCGLNIPGPRVNYTIRHAKSDGVHDSTRVEHFVFASFGIQSYILLLLWPVNY